MLTATYIFGIVPEATEGDCVSATCLDGAVWLRIFPGAAFIQKCDSVAETDHLDEESELPEESPWLCLGSPAGEVLADAVLESGGPALATFRAQINLLFADGTEFFDSSLFDSDSVLYFSNESGCDEIPYEEAFHGQLLIYRVEDTATDGPPPSTKKGEFCELSSFEEDPTAEAVVILKA